VKNKLAVIGVIAAILWSNRASPLLEASGAERLVCMMLLVVCVYPFVRWVRSTRRPLPVFELYCLMHAVYYLQPYVDGRPSLFAFPESVRIQAGLLTVAFLASAIAVFVLRDRTRAWAGETSWILRREMGSHSDAWFAVGLAFWLAYNLATVLGVFPNVGAWTNVFATAATAAGTLATYYFVHAIGRRRLTKVATAAAIAAIAAGVLITFASGYLIAGSLIATVALVAYTMASNRLPILTAVVCLAVVNFLHLGKADMRARFWTASAAAAGFNPLVVFPFWTQASWRRFANGLPSSDDGEEVSLVTRATLAQMLATVVDQTPDKLPFLDGETFWEIPTLFVPRALLRDKPDGNLPSETIAIYYGVQSTESVKHTSIGLGQVAEGWANFGWAGVVMLGAVFGWLFSIPSKLTRSLPPNTVGYLLSAVTLAWATDLEHGLGTFLVSLCQTLFLASILLYVVSKPGRRAARRAVVRVVATAR
jgi:hypothetical protein